MKTKGIASRYLAIVIIFVMLVVTFSGCGEPETDSEKSMIPLSELVPYDSDSLLDAEKVEPLKDVFNILLIGVDEREKDEEYSRSDVMIIVSIDPHSNKIKLSSVLRDCYVDVPGYGKQKLNRAFTIGGEDLLVKTIATNFDVPIKGYVMVDFNDFQEIINILGGVPIELSEAEIQHMFADDRKAGTYTLSAKEALDYVRIRMIDNDWYRTNRQRSLMFAVYKEGVRQTETRLLELFYKIYPLVSTDLSITDMVQLFYQYTKMDNVGLGEMYLPADGTFEETTVDGEFVLNIDLEENQLRLNNFIYKDEEQELELT